MSKQKVFPARCHTQGDPIKPLRKHYESQSLLTALMNNKEGKEKYVSFDARNYAYDAERYIEWQEKEIIRLKKKIEKLLPT